MIRVLFDGVEATGVVVKNDNELQVTTPPARHGPGVVSVVVERIDGSSTAPVRSAGASPKVRWGLTYELANPASVASHAPGYPGLNVTFRYNGAGQLQFIDHTLELEPSIELGDVERESMTQIGLMWRVLEYRYGVALLLKQVTATSLSPGTPAAHQSSARLHNGFTYVDPIVFPTEKLIGALPPKVAAYVEHCNRGRASQDPAAALRHYFLVIEDLPVASRSAQYKQLKFMRHFISHPELKSSDVLMFLRAELGAPVTRYMPLDRTHDAAVRKWRDIARKVVETEIDAMLSAAGS